MIKSLIVSCLRPVGLAGITVFFRSGLREEGWFRSVRERRPIDSKGNPLPWYSYPAIHFLSERVTANMNVFEFGAGYSSLWFASRVASVTSVEHDSFWYEHIKKWAPSNQRLIFDDASSVDSYTKTIIETAQKYDLVVIDSEHRLECIPTAIASLSDGGVIVFDNTQVSSFDAAYSILTAGGFRHIDFVGPLPIHHWNNTTTIFYRSKNILGI